MQCIDNRSILGGDLGGEGVSTVYGQNRFFFFMSWLVFYTDLCGVGGGTIRCVFWGFWGYFSY